jgi:hypothetical protein
MKNKSLTRGLWVLFIGMALLVGLWFVNRWANPLTVPNAKIAKAPLPTPQISTNSPRNISRSQLNTANSTGPQDAQIILDCLRDYHLALKNRPSAPLGTNQEFTRVLIGKNPLRATFIPPNSPAVNAQGELIDRWNTPYFFHALASDTMQIRSAGPDKVMYSADDILAPKERPGYEWLTSDAPRSTVSRR